MIDDAIKIRMVTPDIALRPYIKTYWVLSSQDELPHAQHIVPNGCAGIIFYRMGDVSMSGAGKANAALAGATLQPIEILRKGQAEMIGVQFSEFGLRILLGFSANEVFQTVCRFDAFEDKGLMELEDRIMMAKSVSKCFSLLDVFFLKRLADAKINPYNIQRINAVLKHIKACPESFNMKDFASAACLSPRQLSRVFDEYVGVSPSGLVRLYRCNSAIAKIRKAKESKSQLTAIAYECGYYDLSHMNAEFRSICGASPTSILLSTQNERGNYSWGLEREE